MVKDKFIVFIIFPRAHLRCKSVDRTKLYDLNTLKKSLGDLKLQWTAGNQIIQDYNGQSQKVELLVKQKNNGPIV